MKTSELLKAYLDHMHTQYERIVLGKGTEEGAAEKSMQLAIQLGKQLGAEERDATLWRALKNGLNSALAEAEFKMEETKGRMN